MAKTKSTNKNTSAKKPTPKKASGNTKKGAKSKKGASGVDTKSFFDKGTESGKTRKVPSSANKHLDEFILKHVESGKPTNNKEHDADNTDADPDEFMLDAQDQDGIEVNQETMDEVDILNAVPPGFHTPDQIRRKRRHDSADFDVFDTPPTAGRPMRIRGKGYHNYVYSKGRGMRIRSKKKYRRGKTRA